MARFSLMRYFVCSVLFGIISIFYAFIEYEQFYPCVVALTTSKTHILVMGNLGFALAVTCGSFAQRILFGVITDDESREVLDKAKYAFIDICICLTIFRTDLTVTIVSLFTILLLAKGFHWIAQLRVETVSRLRVEHYFQIIRVAASLICLLFADLLITAGFLYIIVHLDSFGVLILFTFEFSMLVFSTCSSLMRFFILLIDSQHENEWSWKHSLLFCVEFTFDVLKLVSYLGFFIILTKYYSMPIHLLRELYFAFSNVRRRFEGFVKYRRLLRALRTRFPDVRKEQFEGQDRDLTCIICRSDVDVGKQLPCGHIFHLNCLKQWFQEQATCPTCRFDLSSRNIQNVNNAQNPAMPIQPNRDAAQPPAPAPAVPNAHNNNNVPMPANNNNPDNANVNVNGRPQHPPPFTPPPFGMPGMPLPFMPSGMPGMLPPPPSINGISPFPGMPQFGFPQPPSIPSPDTNLTPQQNIHMIQQRLLATRGLSDYHTLLASNYNDMMSGLTSLQTKWEIEYKELLEQQKDRSEEQRLFRRSDGLSRPAKSPSLEASLIEKMNSAEEKNETT